MLSGRRKKEKTNHAYLNSGRYTHTTQNTRVHDRLKTEGNPVDPILNHGKCDEPFYMISYIILTI